MLTPQDITDKVFIKAVFGGYDMTGVDEFLETVSSDYTALYKENAILKGKLKVLVEKVEEYRSTEDAMRMALLTAQRMGDEIMSDANKEKDQRLLDADLEAKTRVEEAARRVADEEMRLSVAARETAKFIELSQAIIKKHSEFLTKLETARRTVRPLEEKIKAEQTSRREQENAQAAQPARYATEKQPASQASQQKTQQTESPSREDEIADTAEQIESAIERITGAGENAGGAAVVRTAYEDDDPDAAGAQIDDEEALENTLTPRPKFDFDNLQFGENFAGGK